MFRKRKWQIPGELLAARYNWCQGPVPGRGPAVEKHWPIVTREWVGRFGVQTPEAGKHQGIRALGRSIHKGTIVLQWTLKYGVRVQYRLSCPRVGYIAGIFQHSDKPSACIIEGIFRTKRQLLIFKEKARTRKLVICRKCIKWTRNGKDLSITPKHEPPQLLSRIKLNVVCFFGGLHCKLINEFNYACICPA